MLKRMIVALSTGLAAVGSTFAQTPTEKPPVVAEQPVLAPCACQPGDVDGIIRSSRLWVGAEAVVGWFSGDNLPALVTTSPPGTARTLAGIPGPNTTTLIGNNSVNEDGRLGLRLQGGYWFNEARTIGIEVGIMDLESQSSNAGAVSDGSTILARPFIDAVTGAPSANLIAFPGSSSGAVSVRAQADNFYETHADLIQNLCDKGCFRCDLLTGFRYYHFSESLRIRQSINPTGGNFVAGTQIVSEDNFGTHHNFYGIDFGLRPQFNSGPLTVSLLAKLAVGNVQREADISGTQITTVPGTAPVVLPGGLYALSSNSGAHHVSDWVVMPEFGIEGSWKLTCNLKGTLGYSAFMLNRAGRAVDQIDPVLNTALLPPATAGATPSRPGFLLMTNDVWVQTLHAGLEWDF
jgi:hypothetical protein